MTSVAIYARYSSDKQSQASIEDQIRVCEELAKRNNWHVIEYYTDYAISGSDNSRPGYQKLMKDANSGIFDIVVAEALDRITRDMEDTAAIYKRLQFFGVKLFTLAEREINEFHVGMKGTMNALYLKDLAQKTHRGQKGRVLKGKSAGGISYGYNVARRLGANGEPVRGEREINRQEAAIVKRIFKEYEAGKSPRDIAIALNNEGIKAPSGNDWGPSTIYGNRTRGTGIINNELYIGIQIWNRQRYRKDPVTRKRVSRMNPEEEWVVVRCS